MFPTGFTGSRIKFSEPLAVSFVISVLVIMGFLTFSGFRRLQHKRAMVSHSYKVLLSISAVAGVVKESEASQRGYIITGSETYWDAYLGEKTRANDLIDHLDLITADNPEQGEKVNWLRE